MKAADALVDCAHCPLSPVPVETGDLENNDIHLKNMGPTRVTVHKTKVKHAITKINHIGNVWSYLHCH